MKSDKSISNKDLFEKIKGNDQKAFELLYDRLWQKMNLKALAITADQQKAKDIVQEVWIDLWQRKTEIENNNISGYLLNATRFKSYNYLRESNNKNQFLSDFFKTYQKLNNNVDDSIRLKETSYLLEDRINRLPKKCKEVFRLSRVDGLKNKEIATKLNISKRTVETHISNALKTLKDIKISYLLFF